MKPGGALYIAPPKQPRNPVETMKLPVGLHLRPEFRTQYPEKKESAAGKKASTPAKTTDSGTTEPSRKPAGTQGAKPNPCMDSMWMIAPLLLVFYFFLLRPQKKQEKQLKQMRASLKKGDRVVTSSGMHAIVASVQENVVTVKPTADGPTMIFDAPSIVRVISDDAKAGASEDGKGGKPS